MFIVFRINLVPCFLNILYFLNMVGQPSLLPLLDTCYQRRTYYRNRHFSLDRLKANQVGFAIIPKSSSQPSHMA